MRVSVEFSKPMQTFGSQPSSYTLSVRAGGHGVAWIEASGLGFRTRRRYVAWVRPGQWCLLSDRQTPEGRFGRFIHRPVKST